MAHQGMRKLTAIAMVTLAMVAVPRGAGAGPGEAAGGQRSAKTPGPDLGRADFVVLIWYRRNDPLGTFQYQTYDVRKGEYTAAVDDWIKLMREKYPAYLVHVQKVELARERGATENLKVGSVIHRELLTAAAAGRRFPRCPDADQPGAVRDSKPGLAIRSARDARGRRPELPQSEWAVVPGPDALSAASPVRGRIRSTVTLRRRRIRETGGQSSDADLDHRQRCELRHRRRAAEGVGASLPLHRAGRRSSRRGPGLIERDLRQRWADRGADACLGRRPDHDGCDRADALATGLGSAGSDGHPDRPRGGQRHRPRRSPRLLAPCPADRLGFPHADRGYRLGERDIRQFTRKEGDAGDPAGRDGHGLLRLARGPGGATPAGADNTRGKEDPGPSADARSAGSAEAGHGPAIDRATSAHPLDDPAAGPGARHRDPDPVVLRPPGRGGELARGCAKASLRRHSPWHWRRSGWAVRSPYGHRWRVEHCEIESGSSRPGYSLHRVSGSRCLAWSPRSSARCCWRSSTGAAASRDHG